MAKEPSAAYLGTRCWAHAARNELALAKADCQAAIAKTATLLDQGMLAFVEGERDKARSLWESAAAANAADGRDVEPWLQRLRADQ